MFLLVRHPLSFVLIPCSSSTVHLDVKDFTWYNKGLAMQAHSFTNQITLGDV